MTKIGPRDDASLAAIRLEWWPRSNRNRWPPSSESADQPDSSDSDHLPLYRQAQIFSRQGVTLDHSTLCNWVGRICWWLAPLHHLLLSTVLASPRVFADDTTLPVLDPGRGKTKTGRLWCYAVDNRPWQGPSHPAAAYMYSEDRKGEHPALHLKGFRGLLQVDGYAGFGRLVTDNADNPRSSSSAGRTRGASSTIFMPPQRRRSPRQRCNASRHSTRSRPKSAARLPSTAEQCVNSAAARSSRQ